MKVADAFKHLIESQKLSGPTFLLFGDDPDSDGITRYQRADLSEGLQAGFERLVLSDSAARARREAANPHTLSPYEPGWRPDRGSHEIQYIELAKDPYVRSILEALPEEEDLVELDPYSTRDARAETAASFVLLSKLPTGERVRYFHRITSKIAILERGALVAKLVGSQFSELKAIPFVFDPKFSCVQVDGFLFLFSPKTFEKLFNYFHGLRHRGMKTVEGLGKLITEETLDVFREDALGSKPSLRRLVSVERIMATHPLTIDDFARTISSFDLPIEIVGKGKDRQLRYEPGQLGPLLKLLADDYVRGESSGLPYESNSKKVHGLAQ